ncbi:MAG: hypothetical protein LC792_01725 [Actinobacteria bacterium]|nr:hypothetical protein [Actinomycetota bacterium]
MTTAAPSFALQGTAGRPYVLAWYGCDLRTGGIIEELRALRPTGALGRRLGASTTTTMELDLDGAPPDWETATEHGRSLLVGVDTDTGLPVWAGMILQRERGSASTVSLGAATLEAYLDRRYTGTVTQFAADQADVVAALMAVPLTQGPPLVMDAPATGVAMDYSVADGDDRTVLSALQEVMGMDCGPEWTIDVEWTDTTQTAFRFPVRVRRQIGAQLAEPEAVFDYPGCIRSYNQSESYESGKGATSIIARGEGEGTTRLSSAPQLAADLEAAGWPRYTYRFTPATGLTDPDALNAHAARALALMATGASVWTVDAVASRAPRIGETWGLGDTVRVAVDASRGHPQGADVVARCWAWELDPGADTVRPILVEED